MSAHPEVRVTLSTLLWEHLRRQAARLEVPMELLVAGLVCDTIEGSPDPSVAVPGPTPRSSNSGVPQRFSMAC
jgi:hypothetical protein